MPIGNPVTLTSNVASKAISVTATASQTLFNVTGGYRINELGVFKNGLRLQDGVDYTARDGLTVTLLSAASGGDKLQFVVFDTFRVAEAIRPAVDEQTIRGNLNVVGILSCTDLEGPVSLNITSGIQTFHDVRVGGALTVAGTLTYEDTTNSNVTGLATFSGGMNISGVGATATTLNVTGVSTFGDKVSIGDSIFHTGDINTSIRFPAADTFSVETGGSERLRITSAGLVGIGTVTPTTKLHVLDTTKTSTTARDNTVARFLSNASNADCNIQLSNGVDHSAQIGIVGDGAEVYIAQDGVERLRVDSSGRIGINDSSPSVTLDITGQSSGNGEINVKRTSGATCQIQAQSSIAVFGSSSNHRVDFKSNSVTAATIDTGQRLLVGSTSSTSNIAGYGNGGIQLNSTTTAQACVNIIHRNNSDNTHAIVLAKARDGAANGGRVQDDDDFGAISFQGFDGTGGSTYRQGAEIRGAVDGTPGNTDMPGRLEFLTTPDGSATPTERLHILSGGQVNIGGNYTQTTYTMQVTGTINATGNITQNGTALASTGKAIAMAMIFG